MNSAALPATALASTATSPWEEVRRIYRRACVLRALGQPDAAAALEDADLSRALAAARLATEDATREHTVLGEEAERVAQAQMLAELVAPLLAQRLRAELPTLSRSAAAAPLNGTDVTAAAAPAARDPAAEVPPIADLIDSMLAQQATPNGRRS